MRALSQKSTGWTVRTNYVQDETVTVDACNRVRDIKYKIGTIMFRNVDVSLATKRKTDANAKERRLEA